MSTLEIQAERDAQKARWGEVDNWSPAEWAALMSHYATRQAVGNLRAVDAAKFRADVVKVGALALACLDCLDRGAQA